jgi:ribosomal protein S18 acetylase RimI-like enzyme
MILILPADKKNCSEAAEIHLKEIKKGFLNKLGKNFLNIFYEAIAFSPFSFLIVAKDGNSAVGFISGCIESKKFYGYFVKKYFFSIFLVIFLKILNPKIAIKILETIRYSKGDKENIPKAELLTIAVSEKFQGRGIARELFNGFLSEMRKRGVKEFKVVVGENLTKPVNFYEKQGFIFSSYIYLHKNMRSKIYTYKILN